MKFTGKQIKLLELFSKAVANRNRIKILVLICRNITGAVPNYAPIHLFTIFRMDSLQNNWINI